MTILIIEDDPKTGDYLRKGLKEHGYVVDIARDGVDGSTGRSSRITSSWCSTSCCPASTAGR